MFAGRRARTALDEAEVFMRFRDFPGRFVFHCTGSCPRTGATLARVQDLLGPRSGADVFLLSISLDPENDTPEALRRLAGGLRAGPGWTFVTGRKEDMERLRRAFGFTDPDPRIDADRTQHATLLALGDDRTGRWSAVPGLIPAAQIVDALRRTTGERAAARRTSASTPEGALRPRAFGLRPHRCARTAQRICSA